MTSTEYLKEKSDATAKLILTILTAAPAAVWHHMDNQFIACTDWANDGCLQGAGIFTHTSHMVLHTPAGQTGTNSGATDCLICERKGSLMEIKAMSWTYRITTDLLPPVSKAKQYRNQAQTWFDLWKISPPEFTLTLARAWNWNSIQTHRLDPNWPVQASVKLNLSKPDTAFHRTAALVKLLKCQHASLPAISLILM